MRGSTFRTTHRVRFEHCDVAGILFFPHYVLMLNRTVEDWLADGLGCDFEELHGVRGLAIPTARLELDMTAPSLLGDVLDWELTVAEIRTTAVVLRHRASAGGAPRLAAVQRIVFARQEGLTKTPVPADLRSRIEAFLPEDGPDLGPRGGAGGGGTAGDPV